MAVVESGVILQGRYATVREIERGKMSTVWLGEDRLRGNLPVALKLLDSEHPDALRREIFRRETLSLDRLNHTNIIRIFDHGWSAELGCFFIVLEFVPRTLLDVMADHPDPLDTIWCWPIMRCLAEALTYAHSEGVIHRDLKPSNILVGDDLTPKLTDFGISRLLYHLSTGMTVSGFWSIGYSPPEQRANEPGDQRSDIFALGAVYYHLLSRRAPPADGPGTADVEALTHVERPIRNLLKRMLAPDPAVRIGDASQVRRSLDLTESYNALSVTLVVTDRARRDLFNAGFIDDPSYERAASWLEDELGGSELKLVAARLNERGITLLTDQVRLRTARDQHHPALVITRIEIPYGPDMEAQRSASAEVRVFWNTRPNVESVEAEGERGTEAQMDLEELMTQLTTEKRQASVEKERRVERRGFLDMWDTALKYQRSQLDTAAAPLPYTEVRETDNQVTFVLRDPAPDPSPWPSGAALQVEEGERRRGVPVGTLIDVEGREVQVDSSPMGEGSARRDRRRQLPTSGSLALNLGEEAAALDRQRQALVILQSGGSLNPRFAEILADVRRAEFDDLRSDLAFFQPELAEDKREAVRRALAARDLFLLQGPPGTGKTTVIAELILQLLAQRPDIRILLSSQSNVAVNHALSRVAELRGTEQLEVVRIGRAEKIGQGAEAWSIDQRQQAWRAEVLARCEQTLKELTEQSQRFRAEREQRRVPREVRQRLAQCREWIEEAASLAVAPSVGRRAVLCAPENPGTAPR